VKVAVIFNKEEIKDSDVIYRFGMPTKERYKPRIIEMVASALEKGGHNVRIFEGNKFVIDDLQNFMPRVVSGERLGMIFNMAYGIQGQSRYTHIPAMLEMLGLPYVGSGPAAHALALDKVLSKIIFSRYNLPTPEYWVYSTCDDDFSCVKFPAIVKPKMEAISFGIKRVTNEKELREAISFIISEFKQQALVEAFIPGREFAVGLLGNGSSLETLPIVEIDLNSNPNAIQTLKEKMDRPRRKICPAPVTSEITERLGQLARDTFNSLGLHDFARVDFRMDKDNNIYILEINSMASLNPTGSFVYAGEIAGLSFEQLVIRMFDTAALRYFGREILKKSEIPAPQKGKSEQLDTRVRSFLRGHLSTCVDYIDHMVSTNSYVHNIEGVNTLGKWISDRFKQLGFKRQLFPQTEIGNILYFTNHAHGKNDYLLCAHLDTEYDYRSFVPFREDRGKLYGSGIARSKGGIAVILIALQALRFSRLLKTIKCGVLFTTDYFLNSRYSQNISREIMKESSHIIGMRHSDLHGVIGSSCVGMQKYMVDMSNFKNHRTNQITDLIASLTAKINAWKKLASQKQGVVIISDAIQANQFMSTLPDYATVQITAYFKSKDQGQWIDQQVKKIATKGSRNRLQVRVQTLGGRAPVKNSSANQRFYTEIQKTASQIEVTIDTAHFDTTSDISFAADKIPTIEGMGPLGNNCGSPDEFIIRDSLIDRAALLAMILYHGSSK
jgi:D-alanine-D-alanine ligase